MKKRVLSLLTTLAIVVGLTVCLPTISVSAYYKSGDYEYEILDDGTVEITYYFGSSTKLSIPSKLEGYTVTSIGDGAMEFCDSLIDVTIPDTVTSIGDNAFTCCSRLKSITLPSSVTSIGDYAFDSCDNLTGLVIPNSVKSIGADAFSYCTSLTNITIPGSVMSIGNRCFYYCISLTNIYVDTDNKYYSSADGVLYNKDQTKIICCPSAKANMTIPNSVTSIGRESFANCSFLTSITIPNTVTSIDDGAFEFCDGLTSVIIPDSVTSMDQEVFVYCTSLTEITISNSVTSIRFWDFAYCESLENITIPDSVTSITGYAFDMCKSLTSITIPVSVENIGDNAFYGCNNLVINCYADSYAEQYAIDNNITYALLEVTVPTVSAKSIYTSTSSAVRINWNKVSGATGYRIYRYNSTTKKWVKVTTIKNGSATTYKQTGLKSGTTYKYKVKAYIKAGGVNYWGNASSTITTSTKPATATFTTASKTKTAIRLNWKKVTGASGYQIQKYNSSTKKWSTVKTITSGSTLTYRISGLKKGTVYKYRIRAYRTVNSNKLCGAWSATKKVTTKS